MLFDPAQVAGLWCVCPGGAARARSDRQPRSRCPRLLRLSFLSRDAIVQAARLFFNLLVLVHVDHDFHTHAKALIPLIFMIASSTSKGHHRGALQQPQQRPRATLRIGDFRSVCSAFQLHCCWRRKSIDIDV